VSSKFPAGSQEHPDELAQLPHGRHGLPQEFVEHNQRERLIASFTHLVGEVGYGGATITAVTEGAGVASRTFYKYFETIDEVCIAAFEKAVGDLRPLLVEAYLGEAEWPLRVRATLAVLLADFAEVPDVARLLTVEPFVAGTEIARRHKAAIEEMEPYLREGRELRPPEEPLPDTAERGILGAVNSMIARQVLAGRGEELGRLLPDLVQFVLTPYLGASEARRLSVSLS
jgi:AcrR family transcriptional regulator